MDQKKGEGIGMAVERLYEPGVATSEHDAGALAASIWFSRYSRAITPKLNTGTITTKMMTEA
jgi:hypothetical protein